MKILNTVEDLWNYCLFCPICQKAERKMTVSVGPDEAFELLSYEKDNQFLTLHCAISILHKKHIAKYSIDCSNNSFQFAISETAALDISIEKASSPYFYFYIEGDCGNCNQSYVNSNDLELDFLHGTISNIGLEREVVWLLSQENKFKLTMNYGLSKMAISLITVKDERYFTNEKGHMTFPIIDLDFSNPAKVINKIKTILVFS